MAIDLHRPTTLVCCDHSKTLALNHASTLTSTNLPGTPPCSQTNTIQSQVDDFDQMLERTNMFSSSKLAQLDIAPDSIVVTVEEVRICVVVCLCL